MFSRSDYGPCIPFVRHSTCTFSGRELPVGLRDGDLSLSRIYFVALSCGNCNEARGHNKPIFNFGSLASIIINSVLIISLSRRAHVWQILNKSDLESLY